MCSLPRCQLHACACLSRSRPLVQRFAQEEPAAITAAEVVQDLRWNMPIKNVPPTVLRVISLLFFFCFSYLVGFCWSSLSPSFFGPFLLNIFSIFKTQKRKPSTHFSLQGVADSGLTAPEYQDSLQRDMQLIHSWASYSSQERDGHQPILRSSQPLD